VSSVVGRPHGIRLRPHARRQTSYLAAIPYTSKKDWADVSGSVATNGNFCLKRLWRAARNAYFSGAGDLPRGFNVPGSKFNVAGEQASTHDNL
jgi:hypothetical protein